MDPGDVGIKEKWYLKSMKDTADWKNIRINVYWSNTYESPYLELKRKLKDYDGVGWYSVALKIPEELRGRKIFLHFGGVADSCIVYVNGKKVGEHAAVSDKKGDDQSFVIRIDDAVKWDLKYQHVMVRVMNNSGPGGIHKPVWVVSEL
jgi:hypothetical protein